MLRPKSSVRQQTLTVSTPQPPTRSRPSTARLAIPRLPSRSSSSRAQSAVASLRGRSPAPSLLERPESRSSRLSVPAAVRSDSQSSLGSHLSVDQRAGGSMATSDGSWVSEAATIGAETAAPVPNAPPPSFQVEITVDEPEDEKKKSGLTVDARGTPHLRPRTPADFDTMSMISRLVDRNVQIKVPKQTTNRSRTPLIQLNDDDDGDDGDNECVPVSITVPALLTEARSVSRLLQIRSAVALDDDDDDSSLSTLADESFSLDDDDEDEDDDEDDSRARAGLRVDFRGTTHLRPKTSADYDAMSAISCMLDMGAFDKKEK